MVYLVVALLSLILVMLLVLLVGRPAPPPPLSCPTPLVVLPVLAQWESY